MTTRITPLGTSVERGEPTLHYRSTAGTPDITPISPARAGQTEPSRVDRLIHWLTWAILSVVLLVWAVVGAIFWLPLLLRTMVGFSVSLVQSTMDGKKPEGSARTLRDAVSFYRRGFLVAIDAVMREESAVEGTVRREVIDRPRLMREAFWAAVFWYLLLLLLGVAWSPVELWQWVAGWPWSETLGSVVDGITGAIDGLIGGSGGGAEAVPPAQPTVPVPGT